MFKKGFFIFLAIFFFTSTVSAQTVNDGITVTVSPERPGPLEDITISLVSHSIDLDSSNIIWRKDGKTELSGFGKTAYIFTTKNVGIQTVVGIQITGPDGSRYNKQVTINPMGIDLLWEARDSIVPPLYKGKALPGPASEITFSAIPQIKQTDGLFLSPQSLVYTWNHNYKPVEGGYGKDFLTIEADDLRSSEVVTVEAQSTNKTAGAYQKKVLSTYSPSIAWYELSPLYGPMLEKRLSGNHVINGNDISLIVFPYSFSPKNPDDSILTYDWSINKNRIQTFTPNILSLNREGEESGDALLELEISHKAKLYQSARSRLTLTLE